MNLSMLVEEYCTQLRRREIEGSFLCAKRTAEIMRLLITTQRHPDAASLLEDVRTVGTKLQAAKPAELAIGNIVRRVLHMVREEEQASRGGGGGDGDARGGAAAAEPHSPGLLSLSLRAPAQRSFSRNVSLSNLLDQGVVAADAAPGPATAQGAPRTGAAAQAAAPSALAAQQQQQQQLPAAQEDPSRRKAAKAPQWKAKHSVIEVLNELIDELDGIEAQIAQQAVEHIHASEVILTFGMSDTTALFLAEAAKKREFQVVVAEAAPRCDGHAMARRLADEGVHTTLIADSAVYAMMARANKVLVGAHAVLANGGVIAPSGTALVALAAKRHSVPFVVLVGLHKLSPLFPTDPDVTFNDFKSPADVADFDVVAEAFASQPSSSCTRAEGEEPATDGDDPPLVEVYNPAYDYVRPELVSLFVTDTGGYTPSYVYRLLSEYYSREDYVLSPELLNLLLK